MAKSVTQWMSEGEEVYLGAVEEYRQIEEQLRELAAQWRFKKTEINRIAMFLGKAPMPEENGEEPASSPASVAPAHPVRLNIATGQAVRR